MAAQKNNELKGLLLWVAAFFLIVAMVFARVIFPEILGFTILIAIPLIAVLGTLIKRNANALKGRSAAYSLNSVITVLLVIGIVGVLDFMTSRYPKKFDLTKNKTHTLSDQTAKAVKSLQMDLHATLYDRTVDREKSRMLIDNYKSLSPKFKFEFVDPTKEPARAKAAGIRKYGTLALEYGKKTSNVDDINEEKLTNAIIKITRDKTQTVCAITGHGEKDLNSKETEGYSFAKDSLTSESFEIKDVNLLTEGKIPPACDGILILGPTKSYFKNEAKMVQDYLADGGRAVIALDVNFKGPDYTPELEDVLGTWFVKPENALILNRRAPSDLGATAAIIALFSKDSPITRDFKFESIFPQTRPLTIMQGPPPGMHVQLLAQTFPDSFEIRDFKALTSGNVKMDASAKHGPFTVAVAVEGKQKDSKATKDTRIVIFGTSLFAINGLSTRGGNLDFFDNAVSWVIQDESQISIRSKDDTVGHVELSVKQSSFIMILTVMLLPVAIAALGLAIWLYRRRL